MSAEFSFDDHNKIWFTFAKDIEISKKLTPTNEVEKSLFLKINHELEREPRTEEVERGLENSFLSIKRDYK